MAFVWSSSENEDGLYPDTIQFSTRYDRTTGQLRLEYWRENQMNAAQPHGVVVMDDNEDFNGREIDRQSDIYAQAGVSAGVSVLVPLLVHGINPWRGCPAPSGVYDAAREQVGKVDTTRTIVQVSPCASVVVWIDEQRTIRKIAERSVVDARTARQYLIDLRSRRPDLSADIDRRIAATTSSLVIETTVIFDARLDVPPHP